MKDCSNCEYATEYICGRKGCKKMDNQHDVFDRIIPCMDELLTSSEADSVTVNITTKEDRAITITIENIEDRK